jgi:hypothetical protein
MTLDWAEFFAPLTGGTILLTVILGLVMGVATLAVVGHRQPLANLYWQLAGGVVFFVPLALLRGFEGSVVWERFLATLVLWTLFCIAMFVVQWRPK